MKTIFKKIALVATACLLVASMAACGSAKFDASGYVKGLMDAAYKADYAGYMKLVEVTQAEAEESYLQGLDVEAGYFAEYFDIRVFSDSTKAEVVELYKEIYKSARYEVKEAVEVDGGFNVEVVISPIDILTKVEDEVNSYIDAFNARNDAGEFANLTEEQYEDAYAAGVIEIVKGQLGTITYGEDKTVIVKVAEDGDGLYGLSDEDFANIDQWIIAY